MRPRSSGTASLVLLSIDYHAVLADDEVTDTLGNPRAR